MGTEVCGDLFSAMNLKREMGEFLKHKMFRTGKNDGEMIIRMEDNFLNAEDLLSTLDFKNHVLKSREGITVPEFNLYEG